MKDKIAVMTFDPLSGRSKILVIAFVFALALLGYVYRKPIGEQLASIYLLFTDRALIQAFVSSFGIGAPVVFIIIQISQVLLAPFPGEATGFIGGFLFGTGKGFIYSSIGLTAGSWINFIVGRFLGKRYVRKLIPPKHLDRMDNIVKRQGVLVVFLLFIFPGFPKDYLCLFLGLSAIPLKVFLLLAAIGRMPGTLMLSLQGAYVFEQKYELFALIFGICLILMVLIYQYRERLYQWVEKYDPNLSG